jgi:hypothetical protein
LACERRLDLGRTYSARSLLEYLCSYARIWRDFTPIALELRGGVGSPYRSTVAGALESGDRVGRACVWFGCPHVRYHRNIGIELRSDVSNLSRLATARFLKFIHGNPHSHRLRGVCAYHLFSNFAAPFGMAQPAVRDRLILCILIFQWLMICLYFQFRHR